SDATLSVIARSEATPPSPSLRGAKRRSNLYFKAKKQDCFGFPSGSLAMTKMEGFPSGSLAMTKMEGFP
ncbi:MAG: hypothetical protein ACPLSK_00605, partial [bacterium]